jgi:hypothetical protein
VADKITLHSTPISQSTANEIARVISPGEKIRLQNPADYATSAHQRVIDTVGGTARQRTSSDITTTTITTP